MNRRQVLHLVPLAVASRARAWASPPPLTMRPAPAQPKLPILAVALPGQTNPCALIEMPEHAWGRPRGSKRQNDQRWFYRMYGDDPTLRPPVTWQAAAGRLVARLATPAGIRLESTATIVPDGITITHELHNDSDVDYEMVQAPTCIKLYQPFTDVFLERTYVHHADGLALLASEIPERLRMNAEEWLPMRAIVRTEPPAPTPAERLTREDGVRRYQKLRLADAPFIATVSSPPGWVAASHTLASPSLFSNPARTCHHVDPSAPLPPRATATLALKLYLVRGTVAEAWRRVSESRAQGRP